MYMYRDEFESSRVEIFHLHTISVKTKTGAVPAAHRQPACLCLGLDLQVGRYRDPPGG